MRRLVPPLLVLSVLFAIVPARALTYDRVLAGPSLAAMYPSGLEYDAKNDRIVVADTGRNRILFYSASGAKLPGGFGSFGSRLGQFDTPRDVAIDGQGRIYVADAGNNRIQQFDEDGTFLGAYTEKIYTPIGVSWDDAENQLLVASTSNHRIVKLTPQLALVEATVVNTAGLSIENPRDVTRGPDGNLWISAYKDHQIRSYDDSTSPWTLVDTLGLGTPGSPPTAENLNFPYNVAFSPDGNTAYVSDTGHSTVAVWDLSGADPAWVGRAGTKCSDSPCPDPIPGDPQGVIDDLRRVTVLPNGRIVTADFWGNGLQVFDDDAPTFTPLLDIAGASAKPKGFAEAFGVAVGGGVIYGVDRLNQQVDMYEADGTLLGTFGDRGTQPDEFSWPEAVAVAPDGSVWTADTRGDRLQHWTADVIAGAENPTVVTGDLLYPEDLDVAGDGTVFVADTGNDRIRVWDGGTMTTFAAAGLVDPQGVAVSTRFVFVANTGASEIRKYDRASGDLLKTYGGVRRPQGVAVAPDGSVWVADSGRGRVVHLSAGLVLREKLATPKLTLPHTLAVNGRGTRLYVADTFANRVRVYRI
jgi:DNA-binding beta-propeller fold protein YncE